MRSTGGMIEAVYAWPAAGSLLKYAGDRMATAATSATPSAAATPRVSQICRVELLVSAGAAVLPASSQRRASPMACRRCLRSFSMHHCRSPRIDAGTFDQSGSLFNLRRSATDSPANAGPPVSSS